MRRKRNNHKSIIIVVVLLFIISLGYAYLTSNLSINGTSEIAPNTWNVHFNTPVVTDGSVAIDTTTYASAKAATKEDDTTVSYNVLLSRPGDFYEFTVEVENEGTIDAMIESVSSKIKIGNGAEQEITSSNLPNYLSYSITYSDDVPIIAKHQLKSGVKENYKVHLEYKKDISEFDLPSTAQQITFTFQVNYTQEDNTSIAVVHPAASTMLNTAQPNGDVAPVDEGIYIFRSKDTATDKPDNYVSFNSELWRILGIYGNNLKIIRSAPIGNYKWNNLSNNIWNGSTIQTYLYNTYYPTLNTNAKNMIEENAVWKVGEVDPLETVEETYNRTKNNNWIGKVGLIAAHEYMFSGKETCGSTIGSEWYGCSPWILSTLINDPTIFRAWTINGHIIGGGNATLIYNTGNVDSHGVSDPLGITPVVYLKESVTISGGTGTSTNPYQLAIQ